MCGQSVLRHQCYTILCKSAIWPAGRGLSPANDFLFGVVSGLGHHAEWDCYGLVRQEDFDDDWRLYDCGGADWRMGNSVFGLGQFVGGRRGFHPCGRVQPLPRFHHHPLHFGDSAQHQPLHDRHLAIDDHSFSCLKHPHHEPRHRELFSYLCFNHPYWDGLLLIFYARDEGKNTHGNSGYV